MWMGPQQVAQQDHAASRASHNENRGNSHAVIPHACEVRTLERCATELVDQLEIGSEQEAEPSSFGNVMRELRPGNFPT
jgi:hypothetical protein